MAKNNKRTTVPDIPAIAKLLAEINEKFLKKEDAVGRKNDLGGEIFNLYDINTVTNLGPNVASGKYSHAEGQGTVASGSNSHTEGNQTSTIGGDSHSEGQKTEARGLASHAEGQGTKTLNVGEHAEGRYNVSHGETKSSGDAHIVNTISSVGIGESEIYRRNAVEIMSNGDIYIKGIGKYDGINPEIASTLQKVIRDLQAGGGGGGVAPEIIENIEQDIQTLKVTKQDTLISGQSIKTINGEPILGDGNLVLIGSITEKQSEIINEVPQMKESVDKINNIVIGPGITTKETQEGKQEITVHTDGKSLLLDEGKLTVHNIDGGFITENK